MKNILGVLAILACGVGFDTPADDEKSCLPSDAIVVYGENEDLCAFENPDY